LLKRDASLYQQFLGIVESNAYDKRSEILPSVEKAAGLFNGPLIRARHMRQDGMALKIDAELSDYMHHVATRSNENVDQRANPLYAAAVVFTADGQLLFGVSGTSTEAIYTGRRNIPAGLVHPVLDAVDGKPYVAMSLQRELLEEAGLVFENFEKLHPFFVVREDEMRHPSVIYEGRLSIDEERTLRRFEAQKQRDLFLGERPEFDQLVFVKFDRNSLQNEIENNRSLYHNRVLIILKHLLSSL